MKEKHTKNAITQEIEKKEIKEKQTKRKKLLTLIIVIVMMVIILMIIYYSLKDTNDTNNKNEQYTYSNEFLVKNNLIQELGNNAIENYNLHDSKQDINYTITVKIRNSKGLVFDYTKCENNKCQKETKISDNINDKVIAIGYSTTYILALTENGKIYQNEINNYEEIPDFTTFKEINTNNKIDSIYIDSNYDLYAKENNNIKIIDEYNQKLGTTYQKLYPYPITMYIPQYNNDEIFITYDNKLIYETDTNKNYNKNKYIEDDLGKTICIKEAFQLSNNKDKTSTLYIISEDDYLYQMEFDKSNWKNNIKTKPSLINSASKVKNYTIDKIKNEYTIGSINIVFDDNSSKQIKYTKYVYSTTTNDYYGYNFNQN